MNSALSLKQEGDLEKGSLKIEIGKVAAKLAGRNSILGEIRAPIEKYLLGYDAHLDVDYSIEVSN